MCEEQGVTRWNGPPVESKTRRTDESALRKDPAEPATTQGGIGRLEDSPIWQRGRRVRHPDSDPHILVGQRIRETTSLLLGRCGLPGTGWERGEWVVVTVCQAFERARTKARGDEGIDHSAIELLVVDKRVDLEPRLFVPPPIDVPATAAAARGAKCEGGSSARRLELPNSGGERQCQSRSAESVGDEPRLTWQPGPRREER